MFNVRQDDTEAIALLDNLIGAINRVPATMQQQVARRIATFRPKFKQDMIAATPEALPDHPFIWSNDPVKQGRARRWYFANKVAKGSKGGRYARTGELMRSWFLRLDNFSEYGGAFVAFNNAPGADYVLGDKMVVSHGLTGWGHYNEVLDVESALLADGISNDWQRSIDLASGAG